MKTLTKITFILIFLFSIFLNIYGLELFLNDIYDYFYFDETDFSDNNKLDDSLIVNQENEPFYKNKKFMLISGSILLLIGLFIFYRLNINNLDLNEISELKQQISSLNQDLSSTLKLLEFRKKEQSILESNIDLVLLENSNFVELYNEYRIESNENYINLRRELQGRI
jgi:hypothetical protein